MPYSGAYTGGGGGSDEPPIFNWTKKFCTHLTHKRNLSVYAESYRENDKIVGIVDHH